MSKLYTVRYGHCTAKGGGELWRQILQCLELKER